MADDGDDGLAVALYLRAETLARLDDVDPRERLDQRNLGDFWAALEGVSHFLYLTWNAQHDRRVSRLELELQAEVDKYVTTCDWLAEQGDGRFPQELHSWLFRRSRVDESLAGEHAALYRRASEGAARLCERLQPLLKAAGPRRAAPGDAEGRARARVESVLRRFYRLPDLGKLAACGRTPM